MAYGTKYYFEFQDIDGDLFKVLIQPEGYSSTTYELEPGPSPVTPEFPTAKDKLNAVNGGGFTLSVFTGNYNLTSLFTADIYGIKVLVQKDIFGTYETILGGYVNTENYTQPHVKQNELISITCNDGLAALKREKYFQSSWLNTEGLVNKPFNPEQDVIPVQQPGVKTIADILKECFKNIVHDRIYTIIDISGETDDFLSLSADHSNYIDEDSESLTKREVLERLLYSFGLRLYVFNNGIWIFDPTLLHRTKYLGVYPDVSFTAYDTNFIEQTGESDDFNPDLILETDPAHYINASQSFLIQSSFNELAYQYNPRANTGKVIPYTPSNIPLEDSEAWVPYQRKDSEGNNLDFLWLRGFGGVGSYVEDYGVHFGTEGSLTEHLTAENGSPYYPPKNSGKKAFVITNSANSGSTAPDEDTIEIKAGYIPKTTDTISIKFNVRIDDINPIAKKIKKVKFPMKFRIGTTVQYGQVSNNQVTSWSSSVGGKTIVATAADDAFRNDTPVQIDIQGTPEAGQLRIFFGRETECLKASGVSEWFGVNFFIFFSDFEILINGEPINTNKGKEYIIPIDDNYKDRKTIKVFHSSDRANGCLDRGCFWNSNGEHEINFDRASFSAPGPLPKVLAKGYMNNYAAPFKAITGDIKAGSLLKADDRLLTKQALTPLSVIMDPEFGDTRFMFMGGTMDLRRKIVSGTWHEIKNADYTIT